MFEFSWSDQYGVRSVDLVDLMPPATIIQPGAVGAQSSIRLTWTAPPDADIRGYDVFRSQSEDGPFERLNPEVIEGAGTTDEPTRYEYVDDTIDPRRTYYYYVESISMAGVRQRFTPIGEAPPKIPPLDDPDTEPR